jgi:hypothetical protein
MEGFLVIGAFVLCIACGVLGYQVGEDHATDKWVSSSCM